MSRRGKKRSKHFFSRKFRDRYKYRFTRARRQQGGGNELSEMKHFYPRKPTTKEKSVKDVPLIVYLTWNSRSVPAAMKQSIENSMANNPDCDFYIFSDEDCRKFLEENYDAAIVKAFDCLKPGAYKSDLWRYCILYKLGGIYIDIKMRALMPFRDLINELGAPLYVKDRDVYGKTYGIWNGFLASAPGNPIFKQCIDEVVNHVNTKFYGENNLEVSGPHLLGRLLGSTVKPPLEIRETGVNAVGVVKRSDGLTVLEQYGEYRDEQRQNQATEHYSKAWDARNVYGC